MNDRFDELLRRLGEISDLEKAAALLSWDEETKMPPTGAAVRAEQRATLNRVAHDLQTAPELGELLEELRPFEEEHEPDSFEAALVRVSRRDYEKAARVPSELRAELTRCGSLGYRAWLESREAEDYAILLPLLRRGLELRREYVACFDPTDDPYDVLLDDYEPGTKTAEVTEIFDQIKAALVPLIRAVSEAEPIDDSCLHGAFDRRAQRRFSMVMLERWGMDAASWRLDRTVHPFATSMSPCDIRLTTNFHDDSLHGVLSCLHEFGHGLYERQVDPRFARTPLAHGVSAAFHESQSRLWENMVGRGRPFCGVLAPRIAQTFGGPVADVDGDALYRAVNRVTPSLIRVEADEVTYSLHIVIRFELEQELVEGRLAIRDLPEAWNARYKEYLGVDVPNDAHGVLQDVHWAAGLIGYFPTYALGNLIAGQLFERAHADLPDLDAQLGAGQLRGLREWLREHVHRHGAKFSTSELLQRVVGGPIAVGPFVEHLKGKISQVYDLQLA